MSQMNTKTRIVIARLIPVMMAAVALLVGTPAHAAVPGITGLSPTPTFTLSAEANFISQP